MLKGSKKRCADGGCREWSTHGVTAPLRCEAHAWPRDVNLVEQPCVGCGLVYLLDDDGHCESCDPRTAKRARLAKQREVEQFLEVCMSDFPPTSVDRTPADLKACGDRERPDVLWERPDRVVILEVDEHQHLERNCACEQTRMVNIAHALGAERTLWVRYNPDEFRGGEARAYASTTKRLEALREALRDAFTRPLEAMPTIGVCHLFFDGFRYARCVGVYRALGEVADVAGAGPRA